jgi:hypothetical protein
MKYLIIDASLHGTGIRDEVNGGYIEPKSLGIQQNTIEQLIKWLAHYEEEHFNGYTNNDVILELDNEGKKIAIQIKKEIPDSKISYYSDARLKKESIEIDYYSTHKGEEPLPS